MLVVFRMVWHYVQGIAWQSGDILHFRETEVHISVKLRTCNELHKRVHVF